MKCVAVLVIACMFVFVKARPQDADSINIDRLLKNNAVVNKQINCLLGKGTCDQIGNRLKVSIPEVINRNCKSCTPTQAANARRLISFIQQRNPQAWAQIQARYRQG